MSPSENTHNDAYPNNIWPTPAYFAEWSQHYRIANYIKNTPIAAAMIHIDVNMAITRLGSTLLHLALTNAPYPELNVCMDVLRYLIVDRHANVNKADIYGRTPLTMLITEARPLWDMHSGYGGNPGHGVELLNLMFERGADPNVLYSPKIPMIAECEKWRLVHECAYSRHQDNLPVEMMEILSNKWDASLADSKGRIVHLKDVSSDIALKPRAT